MKYIEWDWVSVIFWISIIASVVIFIFYLMSILNLLFFRRNRNWRIIGVQAISIGYFSIGAISIFYSKATNDEIMKAVT